MGDCGRSPRFGVIINADARGYEETSAPCSARTRRAWTSSASLMARTVTLGQSAWVLVACAVLVAVFAPLAMYHFFRRFR
jgi:hypothetical protein